MKNYSHLQTGELIKLMMENRTKRKQLDDESADLKKEFDAMQEVMLERLDSQGTIQAKSRDAIVTVNESIVPVISDLDAFYTYLLDTRQPWLLQNRPSIKAFREMIEAGEEIPGLEKFTRRTLSLRKPSK